MHRKWFVNRTNREYITYLSRAASITPALAQVLINRGVKTPDEAREFLSGSSGAVSDPFMMAGMREAVSAIGEAKALGKGVFVHGDYDVDGITSTAIMVSALRALGLRVSYYIPNRFTQGYGFGPHAVSLAKEAGASLIITVDCGISSFEACSLAAEEGIGVIITDHHEPSIKLDGSIVEVLLPEALAVINPKAEKTPTKEGSTMLSGAGIALKVASALGLPAEEFLDLAALGTIADVVPFTGENRVIVREGLSLIKDGRRPGIRALKTVSGLDGREIRAGLLSFSLIPRMNAAGRVSEASEVVEMLLTGSDEKASEMAASLDRKNSERQKIEEAVYREAIGLLGEKTAGAPPGAAIVLAGEGWHEGVIGIVASKLTDEFNRPAFVFSINGDTARGSARSVPGFDIHKGLSALDGLLIGFGGHRQAAGVRIKTSLLPEFEGKISGLVAAQVEDFTPTLRVDADISLEEVSFNLVRELSMLEPFGPGNPEPYFGSRGLELLNARVVGKNHLKARLKGGSCALDAIGFDMGGLIEKLEDDAVDAVFSANINEWVGGRTLQLNLKAIRPSS